MNNHIFTVHCKRSFVTGLGKKVHEGIGEHVTGGSREKCHMTLIDKYTVVEGCLGDTLESLVPDKINYVP